MAGRIILHAGPHKTGSTALQRALHGSRRQLAERGVIYPDRGLLNLGHHGAVNWARGWGGPAIDPADVLRGTGDATVILSSENVNVLLDVTGEARSRSISARSDVAEEMAPSTRSRLARTWAA